MARVENMLVRKGWGDDERDGRDRFGARDGVGRNTRCLHVIAPVKLIPRPLQLQWSVVHSATTTSEIIMQLVDSRAASDV